MNNIFSIVAVPAWLEELVTAAGLGTDAYINLDLLRNILSAEDIAVYVRLNNMDMIATIAPALSDCTIYDIVHTSKVGVNHLLPQNMHNQSPTMMLSLRDQMTRVEFEPTSYVFELFNIQQDVYGVKLIKRDTECSYVESLNTCCDKSIDLLFKSYSFPGIAPLRLFSEFARTSAMLP